jgi:hypothetical protein
MRLPSDILVQLGQVGTLILGSLGVWVAMFMAFASRPNRSKKSGANAGSAVLTSQRHWVAQKGADLQGFEAGQCSG